MRFPFTLTRKFPFVARNVAAPETFENVMDDFFVARDRLEAVRTRALDDADDLGYQIVDLTQQHEAKCATAKRAEKARNFLDTALGMEA